MRPSLVVGPDLFGDLLDEAQLSGHVFKGDVVALGVRLRRWRTSARGPCLCARVR